MADRDFKISYDLDFNHRGLAAVNRQLNRTNRAIGARGRGGVVGGLGNIALLTSSIAQGFRRATVAAAGFSVAIGYAVRQASNLERVQRKLQTLIPGKQQQWFFPQGHQAGRFNPIIHGYAQKYGVSARGSRDFVGFLAAQGFNMSQLGGGERTFRFMAGLQGSGANTLAVARAMAQISAADRFNAEEYNQLLDAGVNVKAITGLTKSDLERNITGAAKDKAIADLIAFYTGEKTVDGKNLKKLIEEQANTLDGATLMASNSLHRLSETMGTIANEGGRVTKTLQGFSRAVDWISENASGPTSAGIGATYGAVLAGGAALSSTLLGTAEHYGKSLWRGTKPMPLRNLASGILKGTVRYGAAGSVLAGIGASAGYALGGPEDAIWGGIAGGLGGTLGVAALSRSFSRRAMRSGHPSGVWEGAYRAHKAGRAYGPLFAGQYPGALRSLLGALGRLTGVLGLVYTAFEGYKLLQRTLDESESEQIIRNITGGRVLSASEKSKLIIEMGPKMKELGFRASLETLATNEYDLVLAP